GTVAQTFRAMHSVLNIGNSRSNICTYHTSFTDFLFDRARSKEFFIDRPSWKNILACQWTKVLTEHWKG
ncbi:hypothetical protein L218DRAFT_827603, partial [Marasmius fiardii PR-910]